PTTKTLVILRTWPSANLTCTPGLKASRAAAENGTEMPASRRQTPFSQSLLVNRLMFEVKAAVEEALMLMLAAASPPMVSEPSTAAMAMERTSALGALENTVI